MPLKSRINKLSSQVANLAIKTHLDPRAPHSAVRDYLKDRGFKVSSSKKGLLASSTTEKEVERALDELGKADKKFLSFKSRDQSAYERNQGVRKTFREVEKLAEKQALKYLQLGKEKFQKLQTQTATKKPRQLEHLEKKAAALDRLGLVQRAQGLKEQALAGTISWLKGTGRKKEAKKMVQKKLSEIINSPNSSKSPAQPSSAPLSSPPPDLLGPDV